jgi:hypothetical protein
LRFAKKLAKKEGINSIILYPGFAHKGITEITEAVGPEVGISNPVICTLFQQVCGKVKTG